MLCERCATEIPEPSWLDRFTHAVAGNHVTPQAWSIFEFLWDRRNKPNSASVENLVQFFYEDDPDGGPLYANDIIRIAIHRLRKALVNTPYKIIHTHSVGYRIVPR